MTNDIRIVSRRGFLGNVFSAGALIIGAQLPLGAAAPAAKAASSAAWHPNVYLGIDADGTVILVTHDREVALNAKRNVTLRDGLIVEDRLVVQRLAATVD